MSMELSEADMAALCTRKRLRAPEVYAAGVLVQPRAHPAEEAAGGGAPAVGDQAAAAAKVIASGAPGGHIRVAVRVRPVPPGDDSIIEVAGEGAIAIRKQAATGGNEFLSSQQGRTEERMFDRVFGPDATQAEVYSWSCRPLVESAVAEGRSATIFVYGATGAGKTHTMFGEKDEAQQGLISRAIREVFDTISARGMCSRSGRPLETKVSFLDIYNESVRDLLQDGGGLCKVLEDERKGVVKVTNLREVAVGSAEEALKQLRVGMQARKVEATAANARSSRSHAVFTMTLELVDASRPGPGHPIFQRRGAEQRRVFSRICLIDLAGSERATHTQNMGSALKDGAKINQSLLALANCIDALTNRSPGSGMREGAQTPRRKPPYRDSKLTLLLKSSLTSDCLVSMIANVHPGKDHFEDSNNTLEYAKRASVVKAPPIVRRARAASLPASRPPSPTPSASQDSSASSDELLAPTRGSASLSSPDIGIPTASAGSQHAANSRCTSAPQQEVKKRRRASDRPLSAETHDARSGIPAVRPVKPRSATPEARSSIARPSAEKTRSASAAQLHAHDTSHTSQAEPCRRERDITPLPGRARPGERIGRSSGPRPLARCEESASDATGKSSSFGTAPGSLGSPDQTSPVGSSPQPSLLNISPMGGASQCQALPDAASASPQCLAAATPGSGRDTPGEDVSGRRGYSARARLQTPPRHQHSASAEAAEVKHRSRRHLEHNGSAEDASAGRGNPSLLNGSPVLNGLLPAGDGALSGTVTGCSTNMLLLRLVDSLQAEKAALEERLRAVGNDKEKLEADNARLRAANLEKDRQIICLLGNLPHDSFGAAASSRSTPPPGQRWSPSPEHTLAFSPLPEASSP
mmetsp:Transcript_64814/g.122924  ORF Transcript_64814/g.122924 Transcript_64814/m.122924 type:complete len:868 (-) Transcript_64814:36-2639(-)